jgi:hypothetical protein
MRRFAFPCFALFTLALTSCTTVSGLPVFGRLSDVSRDDIRAAIDADLRESQSPRFTKIHEVEVISRDEIHLHFRPKLLDEPTPYDIVRRIHGKWHCTERSIVIS